jgi:hypothetical protein
MFDILFIYWTMVCVFCSPLIQTRQRWITLKICKRTILSSWSRKASEPLINSTYSFFLALFTIYVLHEIMNSRLFTFPYLYPRCGLHMGRIALLSPAVIAWLLSRYSLVVSWAMMVCGPQSYTMWVDPWLIDAGVWARLRYGGKVSTFMVCGWFLLESAKDRFLGVDPSRTTCAATCLVWNNLLTN